MIKDPVLLDIPEPGYTAASEFSVKSGERFIRTIYPGSDKNLALYYFDSAGENIFSVIRGVGYYAGSVGDQMKSGEAALYEIKELYPDHFEWLLFHPEWL